MIKQVNQQSLTELRASLAEYEQRTDHTAQLILARIREAIAIKEKAEQK